MSIPRLDAGLLGGLSLLVTVGATIARAESLAVPTLYITPIRVTEGDTGSTPFTAQLMPPQWPSPIEVEVHAVPGTAGSDDFVFLPVRLILMPGSAPVTLSGVVLGDRVPEGDEFFTLTATSTGTTFPPFVNSQGGRVDIADDDRPAGGVHVEGITTMEGDLGVSTVQVRVRLEPASAFPVRVDYQTMNGTASAPDDYLSASGTVIFAAGEVIKDLPIQIVGDRGWEPEKKFAVVLSNAVGASLITPRAEIVIANDDPGAVATLADARISEGNLATSTLILVVTFDRPPSWPSKVFVAARPGRASDGEDFHLEAQTLYPSPGETSVSFPITIFGDTRPECDEGFFVDYGALYTGDDTRKTARVLITNDDGQPAGAPCPDPFSFDPSAQPPLPDAGTVDVQGAADTAGGGPTPGGPDAGAEDVGAPPPKTPGPVVVVDAGGVTPLPPPRLVDDSGCSVGGRSSINAIDWAALAALAAWLGARTRRRRC